jgi:hypothetical protein
MTPSSTTRPPPASSAMIARGALIQTALRPDDSPAEGNIRISLRVLEQDSRYQPPGRLCEHVRIVEAALVRISQIQR